jgi:hypothetical protein
MLPNTAAIIVTWIPKDTGKTSPKGWENITKRLKYAYRISSVKSFTIPVLIYLHQSIKL